jgi:hypothetical protein
VGFHSLGVHHVAGDVELNVRTTSGELMLQVYTSPGCSSAPRGFVECLRDQPCLAGEGDELPSRRGASILHYHRG